MNYLASCVDITLNCHVWFVLTLTVMKLCDKYCCTLVQFVFQLKVLYRSNNNFDIYSDFKRHVQIIPP